MENNKSWRPDKWDEIKETIRLKAHEEDWEREDIFEAGADAMLEALRDEVCRHPIFLRNCKSQRKKPAKICIDCPFKMLLEAKE